MASQTEFNFDDASGQDGMAAWQQERKRDFRELAARLGLPLNHPVEVRLKDGVLLRGNLRAGDVLLSLEAFNRGKLALEVDGLVFSYAEMESCVRLD